MSCHVSGQLGPIKLVEPHHFLLKCMYQAGKWAVMCFWIKDIDFALVYVVAVIVHYDMVIYLIKKTNTKSEEE
jgi:hypothetical protein